MKRLIVLLAAGLGLLACTKEAPVAEQTAQPLKFNITVTRADAPDTKVVKTGWEDGDVVHVFFSEADAPAYMKMTYDADAGEWDHVISPSNVHLLLTEGTMTAIYLPFGNDVTVSADDEGNYVFDKMYYSYYLKAEKAVYKVRDGVLCGTLEMQLPEGYVQFFIEDDYPDAGYFLWDNHVAPAGVENIAADGTVNMKVRQNGGAMPGFLYDNGTDPAGYIFSGILDEEARGTATAYTFHLGVSDGDIFAMVSGTKTLYTETSRALKLPDPGFDGWEIDPHPAVDLGLDVKWALTNIGAENPEDYGDYFAWGETEPYYESIAPDGTVTWKAGISNGYDWGAYFDTKDGGNSFIDYATDKKTVLDPADDAATVNWGEPWRIPTAEEWEALLNADDFDREWSENPLGAIFTSKIPGYEGRQIFLPVTGFWYNKDYVDDEAGNYWSSSLYGPIPGDAKCFYFEDIESKMHTSYYYRISGYSVRPVCD